jgi:hypothetical protein
MVTLVRGRFAKVADKALQQEGDTIPMFEQPRVARVCRTVLTNVPTLR